MDAGGQAHGRAATGIRDRAGAPPHIGVFGLARATPNDSGAPTSERGGRPQALRTPVLRGRAARGVPPRRPRRV